MIVIQWILTSKTVGQFKFKNDMIMNHLRKRNIWMHEKILSKKFLSSVGWFANLYYEHVWRKAFKEKLQEILNKITGMQQSSRMEIDRENSNNKTNK